MPRKKKSKAPPTTDKGDESPKAESGAGEAGSGGKRAKESGAPKKRAAKKTGTKKRAPRKKAPKKRAPKKKAPKKKASKQKAPKGKGARKKAEKKVEGERSSPTVEVQPAPPEVEYSEAAPPEPPEVEEPAPTLSEPPEREGREPAPPEPHEVGAATGTAETDSPPPSATAEEPPVEILDDDSEAAESAEELIADLEADLDRPGVVEGSVVDAGEGDDAFVADLDADLDEESTTDAVDRLIAETLAVVKEEDGEAEPEDTGIDRDEPPGTAVDLAPPGQLREPRPEQEAVEAAAGALEAGSTPEAPDVEGAAPARAERDEVSTPEFRDRLLAAALAHAEHQDARYRVPFSDAARITRWKGIIASVLFLIAMVVGFAPPSWVRPEPPPELTPAARARAIRLGLLLQAEQVEAYRVRSQRLPTTLDVLPVRLPGVRYTRSGSRAFQLVAYEPDGNPIVYDSSSPAPEFRSLVHVWMPEDETR